MKVLIVEDDMASRRFMHKFLSRYGECDVAGNGLEAIDLFIEALKSEKKYDLICLDIMMPKLDGMKTLKIFRNIEKEKGITDSDKVKIIMTTALNDKKTVTQSYESGCEAYAWKPIETDKFLQTMKELGLEFSA
jgi:two-component system chemotaxis response regulator CheY